MHPKTKSQKTQLTETVIIGLKRSMNHAITTLLVFFIFKFQTIIIAVNFF
jgi:hypothetical protein